MATSEKLCLQWNDFKENIVISFAELRADNDLTDITLACEDGKQVEAHKVVLASTSPFFRDLLKKNSHPHPLVYMRGLKSEDLIAMMDFLYKGEANVFQENLDSFLALAEELKLKGLNSNTESETDKADFKPPKVYQEAALKKRRPERYREPSRDTNHQISASYDMSIAPITKNQTVIADNEDLDEKIRSMITRSDVSSGTSQGKMATCKICGKEGPYKAMPRHVEANHITGVSHACDICGYTSRSRNGLRQHKKQHS